jgi:molecular chaperone HscB
MGLAPSFRLDGRELEQRQRDLSKALHPDRHATGTPAERRAALSEAISVNEAYRALRDPVTRAEAVLRLLGQPTGSEGETRTQLPPALLMAVMEQREQLGTARRNRDRGALAVLTLQAQAEQLELETLLGDTLGRALRHALPSDTTLSDTAPGVEPLPSAADGVVLQASNASELESAAQALARLRYVRKLLEEAAAVEDDLDAS